MLLTYDTNCLCCRLQELFSRHGLLLREYLAAHNNDCKASVVGMAMVGRGVSAVYPSTCMSTVEYSSTFSCV